MGGWFEDWREDMKGTWLFDTAKSVGRTSAKLFQYGSVPAAALIFGPVGALAATPLAIAAGQVGPNKNRSAQLQRDAISGLAVTGGTAAFNLFAGQNLGSSLINTFSSIFGWGPKPPQQPSANPKPMSDSDLYRHYFPGPGGALKLPPASGGSGGFNPLAFLSPLVGTSQPQANTAQLQQQYQDQLKLAEQFRAAGDQAAAAQAAALAEVYRQQILAQGGTPTGGGLPIIPLLVVGAGAWLLLRRKR